MRTVELWEGETRGQTWSGVRLIRDAVLVMGVDEKTSVDGLRAYVNEAVERANIEAPRERQRDADAAAEAQRAVQERIAAAERLSERFRDPG